MQALAVDMTCQCATSSLHPAATDVCSLSWCLCAYVTAHTEHLPAAVRQCSAQVSADKQLNKEQCVVLVAHLALPIWDDLLVCWMLLIVPQHLQTPCQGHQRGVDGNTLPG